MSDVFKANRGPAAAAENRRAILAAARDLFAEEGFGVAFSAIAKRAGVGQASLYRHFRDKHALAAAVFDENLALLESDAGGLGLRGFLDRIAGQARMSSSLLEALAGSDEPHVAALEKRLKRIIDRILERERAAGRVDPATTVDDIATAVSMVAFHTAFTPFERSGGAVALIERALAPRQS